MTTPSVGELRPVLIPLASNVVDLTLHFAEDTSFPHGLDIWLIIVACDNLKHFELKNVDVPNGLVRAHSSPEYQLTSLTVRSKYPHNSLESDSLTWLVGSSRTTLAFFEGKGVHSLAVSTLPTLVPSLKKVILHAHLDISGQVQSAVQAAEQPSV